jgi:malonate transporter and related proteins
MIATIAGALVPAVVTLMLGYLAARRRDFGSTDAPVLTRVVIAYALPLAIFAGTVRTTRAELGQDLPLLAALAAAVIGLYGVVFVTCRALFRFPRNESVLFALAASAPDAPFFGPAVVGYLYGAGGSIPIAIGSLLINLTVVPLTVILLSVGAGPEAGHGPAPRAGVAAGVVAALKEPLVWLPLLGFLVVLLGIPMPALLTESFELLGRAASGVALFAAGIILAGYHVKVTGPVLFVVFVKNVLQPALVWVGLLSLGYTNPLLGEAVVTAALPMITIVAMLGVRYQVAKTEAASALFISMMGALITVGVFIALTGGTR